MAGSDDLLDIVGAIYEAALDPSCWPETLLRLSELLGGVGAQFMLSDKCTAAVPFSRVGGHFDTGAEQRYVQYYGTIDPRLRLIERLPVGTIIPCHRYFGESYVRGSEFYQDFLVPAGGRYVAGGRVAEVGNLNAIFGFHRNIRQGPFDPQTLHVIERLVPHLQRAARIHCAFGRLRLENSSFAAAVDQASYGVFVVDRKGRPLVMNRTAEALVRRQDGLKICRGVLTALTQADNMALRQLIAGAVDTAAGKAPRGGGLRLARPSGKRPLNVRVAPVSERGGTGLNLPEPATVLLVSDPEDRPCPPADMMATLFGLTAAESRLLAALAGGATLGDAAEQFAVSKATVRKQLQSIFDKTECNRQSELVRLALSAPGATGD